MNIQHTSTITPFVGWQRYRRYAALLWHGRTVFRSSWDASSMMALLPHLKALKGPMVKIAQMVGMIPDMLPVHVAEAWRDLCTHGEAMPVAMVHRLMARQWGVNWVNRVAVWDDQAMASASLGQVHQAVCHDGTPVAVKIQYPTMRQAVHTDLNLIEQLWQWLGAGSMDMSSFREEWATRLAEELDYDLEATRTEQWRQWWAGALADIAIPRVIPSLSGPSILTTTWMSGLPLESVHDPAHRLRMAQLLLRSWAAPFFGAGVLHADPHQGNFLWDPCTQRLVILDFGCTRFFSPHFVHAFCQLYEGLAQGCFEQTYQAYGAMGFAQLCPPVIEALNQWATLLLRPVLTNDTLLLAQVSPPSQAQAVLKHLLHTLAKHGGVTPPPEFLLLDRSILLLGSLCMRLNVPLNWRALWHPYFQQFTIKACEEGQRGFVGHTG